MRRDDEYANAAHIPQGETYYGKWEDAAAAFRDGHALKEMGVVYGERPRQTYDIYHPDRLAKGTIIFVHGGYWKDGSPAMFSHLAKGAVAGGHACAMPQYTLAPDARISEITEEVAQAVAAIAARTHGPLYLVGHSAGGHLVARLGCADQAAVWSDRVARIMAISPLSDLAPLMETTMNETLRIDAEEAQRESPINHAAPSCPVTVWVGAAERPAFVEQARGLGAAWACDVVVEESRHHFDVIEGLQDPYSDMMQTLLN